MEQAKTVIGPSAPVGAPAESKPGKLILALLKMGISASLIAWVLQGTPLPEIVAALREADSRLLLLAFSLHLLGLVLSAYRWRLLLRARGSDSSILFLVESTIVGMFFNNLLPSTIGGDVYRSYDSWRLGQSKSSAVAIVFVDRFLGLLVLMLLALLALLNANELTAAIPHLFVWLGLGTLGMIAFLWLIFAPPRWLADVAARLNLPFGAKIRQIIAAFLAFQGHRHVLGRALVLSALLQVNVIIHYYLIARSLSLPVPFLGFFLIVPLATVLTMLPISVNGIGVRENVYIFFFAAFAVSAPEAVAFAWIAYGLVVLQGLFGGMLYALCRPAPHRRTNHHP
jgi:glycosyltransferase 2 family protein